MAPLLVLLGNGGEIAGVLQRLGISYAGHGADGTDPGGPRERGGAGGAAGGPTQLAAARISLPREAPCAQSEARPSSQGKAPPHGARGAALRADMQMVTQDRRLTTQRLGLRDGAVDMEIQEKDEDKGPRALARRLYAARERMRAIQRWLDEDGDFSGQESIRISTPRASGASTSIPSVR